MKNKFEGYCYVCGEVVAEGAGTAERVPRKPGDAGFGKTKCVVRCRHCKLYAPVEGDKTKVNIINHGNRN